MRSPHSPKQKFVGQSHPAEATEFANHARQSNVIVFNMISIRHQMKENRVPIDKRSRPE